MKSFLESLGLVFGGSSLICALFLLWIQLKRELSSFEMILATGFLGMILAVTLLCVVIFLAVYNDNQPKS